MNLLMYAKCALKLFEVPRWGHVSNCFYFALVNFDNSMLDNKARHFLDVTSNALERIHL